MYIISESEKYLNLNSKHDLIKLIKTRAKKLDKDKQGYTHKGLNNLTKDQLFMVFCGVDREYVNKKGM